MKQWAKLGGGAILAALIGFGGGIMARRETHLAQEAVSDADHDQKVDTDGRIALLEMREATVEKNFASHVDWSREQIGEVAKRFDGIEAGQWRLDRKMDALFIWLGIIAKQHNWTPPPAPSSLNPPFQGWGQTQAAPACSGDCSGRPK